MLAIQTLLGLNPTDTKLQPDTHAPHSWEHTEEMDNLNSNTDKNSYLINSLKTIDDEIALANTFSGLTPEIPGEGSDQPAKIDLLHYFTFGNTHIYYATNTVLPESWHTKSAGKKTDSDFKTSGGPAEILAIYQVVPSSIPNPTSYPIEIRLYCRQKEKKKSWIPSLDKKWIFLYTFEAKKDITIDDESPKHNYKSIRDIITESETTEKKISLKEYDVIYYKNETPMLDWIPIPDGRTSLFGVAYPFPDDMTAEDGYYSPCFNTRFTKLDAKLNHYKRNDSIIWHTNTRHCNNTGKIWINNIPPITPSEPCPTYVSIRDFLDWNYYNKKEHQNIRIITSSKFNNILRTFPPITTTNNYDLTDRILKAFETLSSPTFDTTTSQIIYIVLELEDISATANPHTKKHITELLSFSPSESDTRMTAYKSLRAEFSHIPLNRYIMNHTKLDSHKVRKLQLKHFTTIPDVSNIPTHYIKISIPTPSFQGIIIKNPEKESKSTQLFRTKMITKYFKKFKTNNNNKKQNNFTDVLISLQTLITPLGLPHINDTNEEYKPIPSSAYWEKLEWPVQDLDPSIITEQKLRRDPLHGWRQTLIFPPLLHVTLKSKSSGELLPSPPGTSPVFSFLPETVNDVVRGLNEDGYLTKRNALVTRITQLEQELLTPSPLISECQTHETQIRKGFVTSLAELGISIKNIPYKWFILREEFLDAKTRLPIILAPPFDVDLNLTINHKLQDIYDSPSITTDFDVTSLKKIIHAEFHTLYEEYAAFVENPKINLKYKEKRNAHSTQLNQIKTAKPPPPPLAAARRRPSKTTTPKPSAAIASHEQLCIAIRSHIYDAINIKKTSLIELFTHATTQHESPPGSQFILNLKKQRDINMCYFKLMTLGGGKVNEDSVNHNQIKLDGLMKIMLDSKAKTNITTHGFITPCHTDAICSQIMNKTYFRKNYVPDTYIYTTIPDLIDDTATATDTHLNKLYKPQESFNYKNDNIYVYECSQNINAAGDTYHFDKEKIPNNVFEITSQTDTGLTFDSSNLIYYDYSSIEAEADEAEADEAKANKEDGFANKLLHYQFIRKKVTDQKLNFNDVRTDDNIETINLLNKLLTTSVYDTYPNIHNYETQKMEYIKRIQPSQIMDITYDNNAIIWDAQKQEPEDNLFDMMQNRINKLENMLHSSYFKLKLNFFHNHIFTKFIANFRSELDIIRLTTQNQNHITLVLEPTGPRGGIDNVRTTSVNDFVNCESIIKTYNQILQFLINVPVERGEESIIEYFFYHNVLHTLRDKGIIKNSTAESDKTYLQFYWNFISNLFLYQGTKNAQKNKKTKSTTSDLETYITDLLKPNTSTVTRPKVITEKITFFKDDSDILWPDKYSNSDMKLIDSKFVQQVIKGLSTEIFKYIQIYDDAIANNFKLGNFSSENNSSSIIEFKPKDSSNYGTLELQLQTSYFSKGILLPVICNNLLCREKDNRERYLKCQENTFFNKKNPIDDENTFIVLSTLFNEDDDDDDDDENGDYITRNSGNYNEYISYKIYDALKTNLETSTLFKQLDLKTTSPMDSIHPQTITNFDEGEHNCSFLIDDHAKALRPPLETFREFFKHINNTLGMGITAKVFSINSPKPFLTTNYYKFLKPITHQDDLDLVAEKVKLGIELERKTVKDTLTGWNRSRKQAFRFEKTRLKDDSTKLKNIIAQQKIDATRYNKGGKIRTSRIKRKEKKHYDTKKRRRGGEGDDEIRHIPLDDDKVKKNGIQFSQNLSQNRNNGSKIEDNEDKLKEYIKAGNIICCIDYFYSNADPENMQEVLQQQQELLQQRFLQQHALPPPRHQHFQPLTPAGEHRIAESWRAPPRRPGDRRYLRPGVADRDMFGQNSEDRAARDDLFTQPNIDKRTAFNELRQHVPADEVWQAPNGFASPPTPSPVYEQQYQQHSAEPPKRCAHCNRQAAPDEKLVRCGACRQARYCGKPCQQAHWPSHKAECRKLQQQYEQQLLQKSRRQQQYEQQQYEQQQQHPGTGAQYPLGAPAPASTHFSESETRHADADVEALQQRLHALHLGGAGAGAGAESATRRRRRPSTDMMNDEETESQSGHKKARSSGGSPDGIIGPHRNYFYITSDLKPHRNSILQKQTGEYTCNAILLRNVSYNCIKFDIMENKSQVEVQLKFTIEKQPNNDINIKLTSLTSNFDSLVNNNINITMISKDNLSQIFASSGNYYKETFKEGQTASYTKIPVQSSSSCTLPEVDDRTSRTPPIITKYRNNSTDYTFVSILKKQINNKFQIKVLGPAAGPSTNTCTTEGDIQSDIDESDLECIYEIFSTKTYIISIPIWDDVTKSFPDSIEIVFTTSNSKNDWRFNPATELFLKMHTDHQTLIKKEFKTKQADETNKDTPSTTANNGLQNLKKAQKTNDQKVHNLLELLKPADIFLIKGTDNYKYPKYNGNLFELIMSLGSVTQCSCIKQKSDRISLNYVDVINKKYNKKQTNQKGTNFKIPSSSVLETIRTQLSTKHGKCNNITRKKNDKYLTTRPISHPTGTLPLSDKYNTQRFDLSQFFMIPVTLSFASTSTHNHPIDKSVASPFNQRILDTFYKNTDIYESYLSTWINLQQKQKQQQQQQQQQPQQQELVSEIQKLECFYTERIVHLKELLAIFKSDLTDSPVTPVGGKQSKKRFKLRRYSTQRHKPKKQTQNQNQNRKRNNTMNNSKTKFNN